jgi:biotin carboxyl carrier protein
MYKVKVNGATEYAINRDKETFELDGKNVELDIVNTGNDAYHILHDNKSYRIRVIEVNAAEKKLTIRVNGNDYNLEVKDRFDVLLNQLGMSNLAASKINDIKAPMPGLVLKINVTEGQHITKGEPVLVLEAMKMENVLKAPADAVVKAIKVNIGNAVEKGQVLVVLE